MNSKALNDILKCLPLPTTQRSVSCRSGVKRPENIHIQEAEIKEF